MDNNWRSWQFGRGWEVASEAGTDWGIDWGTDWGTDWEDID